MKFNIVELMSIAGNHRRVKGIFRVSAIADEIVKDRGFDLWQDREQVLLSIIDDAGKPPGASPPPAPVTQSFWGRVKEMTQTGKQIFFGGSTFRLRKKCSPTFSGGAYRAYSFAPGSVGRAVPPAAAAAENVCAICMDAEKTHLFIPCGHQCVCVDCQGAILALPAGDKKCPICRAQVIDSVQVFNS